MPSLPGRSVTVYSEYEHGPHGYGRISAAIKRVSWGAIFAGAVVAVVVQFLLNLLGLGIGLSTFEFASADDSIGGFGMTQGIWTVVSALVALFVGGWVAGRLAGMPRKTDGVLHGIVTWALTTLLTLYLLTTGVGRVVSGATSLLGQGLNLAAQGVTAVAPQAGDVIPQEVDLSGIKNQAQQLLRDVAVSPGDAATDVENAIDRTFGGNGPVDAGNRQDLIETIVARTGMTEEEAERAVNQWERQYNQARQQVVQTADSIQADAPDVAESAADYVGTAALIAFFALLLGAGAAAIGGAVGSPEDLPAEAVGQPEVTGRHV